jgi:hypothetical protein
LVIVHGGCNRQNSSLPSGQAGQPDETLLGELGDAIEINGYLLRPPRGYQETTSKDVPTWVKMVAWRGTTRSDGTAPAFAVAVGVPPAGERVPDLDELLTVSLDAVKRRKENWSESTPDEGTINGLVFLRARWSGTVPDTDRKLHGAIYVALDGRTVIQLGTQDAEPHHEQELKLWEAAARTFKKQ